MGKTSAATAHNIVCSKLQHIFNLKISHNGQFIKFIWICLFNTMSSLQHKQALMEDVKKNEGLLSKNLYI